MLGLLGAAFVAGISNLLFFPPRVTYGDLRHRPFARRAAVARAAFVVLLAAAAVTLARAAGVHGSHAGHSGPLAAPASREQPAAGPAHHHHH